MKVQAHTIEIPAHTETVTIWVADDGTNFIDEEDCKEYEEKIKIKNHPVMKSKTSITDFDGTKPYSVYYISSEDDWTFLYNNIIGKEYRIYGDNYSNFGPGWYLVDQVLSFNSSDYCEIYYLKNWMQAEDEEYADWREPIKEKFGI